MTVGLDIGMAITGLVKVVVELLIGMRDLVGSIPKCQALLASLDTLHKVLQRALKEYELSMATIGTIRLHDLKKTNDLLLRCLRDCDKSCKDYDAVLTKILRSRIRPLKWKMSQADLKDVAARLESNKSTLLTCLSTIR